MPRTTAQGVSDIKEIRKIANSPARDEGYTRTYYSYPAKFQAHLPNALIKMLTAEGDLIADPFCGGGTTGLECLILGRASINYDLNPFAIFVSKVKTTKLDTKRLLGSLETALDARGEETTEVLDAGDRECLGPHVSRELNIAVSNINRLRVPREYKDFFRLGVIHTTKIIGRRDSKTIVLEEDENDIQLFASASLRPQNLFMESLRKKLTTMIGQMSTLPEARFAVEFHCQSNHDMSQINDEAVDLIITSPPYKDIDVEYALIQIQRPHLRRSKRSN